MSNRFYSTAPLDIGESILAGPEAHHLAQVRRFAVGDSVILFNGDGREYRAEILAFAKRQVRLKVTGVAAPDRELGFPLHMAVALPKADRGDYLIEKLTELGVTDLTPIETARSIVRSDTTKLEKLRRAVIEASKQCGRNVLMNVHPPCRLEEWCCSKNLGARKWIADPEAPMPAEVMNSSGGFAVAVGPEGGFTKEEIAAAVASGFERIGLGPCILRVETAGVALAAMLGVARRSRNQ
jgi:16S rRNA (uracil1498-N3)-methyltransferase